jgi:hypothetical protein
MAIPSPLIERKIISLNNMTTTGNNKICIFSLDKDMNEKLVATCYMNMDEVSCEGEDAVVQNLIRFGVFNHEKNRQVFPKDGAVFLESLAGHFTSGYMTAGSC